MPQWGQDECAVSIGEGRVIGSVETLFPIDRGMKQPIADD